MADNYTHVSFSAVLPRDIAHEIMQGIELLQEYGHTEYGNSAHIPEEIVRVLSEQCSVYLFSSLMEVMSVDSTTCTNCTAKVEDIGNDDGTEMLVVYSTDGDANVEGIADIIGAVLAAHEDDSIVAFEWANTCSKPRVGEFGGGFVCISRYDTVWGNTAQLAAGAVQDMRKQVNKHRAYKGKWEV